MADVLDAIIAEALGEGPAGMAAVAHVIATRAAQTGMTPEQVINQASQFSGVTNPGRSVALSMKDPEVRAQAQGIWDGVQSGAIPNPYPGADHFHTPQVSPSWASAYTKLGQTGNHIFYASGTPSRQSNEAPVPMAPSSRPSEALAAINSASPVENGSTPWLSYANQGATRSQPLSDKLTGALGFLPELGVTMEVFSGGQPSAGNGPRVGSERHDHGDAADVFFYKNGQQLDWANPNDLPIFEEIVRRGKAAGITGFGAGEGYMRPGSMHLGFGAPSVWGAGGKGANAPEWLKAAYFGQAAPTVRPAVARSTDGNWWSNPMGTLTANIGGIMGSVAPQTQAPDFRKSLMNAAMSSLPVRTAFVKSLMNQNIGEAPSVSEGHVSGGSPVTAINSSGSRPVTLMSPSNPGSSAFDRDVHAGQDMNVYRANREAVGDRLTQSNIERALSGGSTLYRR